MKREEVNEQATRNTAAVIADLDPDILAVVEAEDRPALVRFNDNVLELELGEDQGFAHIMLIDGNDERGINVGLLAKDDFPVVGMRSHVDDPGSGGEPVFSRDCAEYEFEVGGQGLLLMVNHFKSKGYGSASTSNKQREAQAGRVAEIYKERSKEGWERIVVLRDFNDTPDSKSLAPLPAKTDLKGREPGERLGLGRARRHLRRRQEEKIDYLLLLAALFSKVKVGGVDRKRAVAWTAHAEPVGAAADVDQARGGGVRPRRDLGGGGPVGRSAAGAPLAHQRRVTDSDSGKERSATQ